MYLKKKIVTLTYKNMTQPTFRNLLVHRADRTTSENYNVTLHYRISLPQ